MNAPHRAWLVLFLFLFPTPAEQAFPAYEKVAQLPARSKTVLFPSSIHKEWNYAHQFFSLCSRWESKRRLREGGTLTESSVWDVQDPRGSIQRSRERISVTYGTTSKLPHFGLRTSQGYNRCASWPSGIEPTVMRINSFRIERVDDDDYDFQNFTIEAH